MKKNVDLSIFCPDLSRNILYVPLRISVAPLKAEELDRRPGAYSNDCTNVTSLSQYQTQVCLQYLVNLQLSFLTSKSPHQKCPHGS